MKDKLVHMKNSGGGNQTFVASTESLNFPPFYGEAGVSSSGRRNRLSWKFHFLQITAPLNFAAYTAVQ